MSRRAADSPAETPGLARGRWHHALSDGRVQCDLCPRYCKLNDGQRGFCFVRQRAGDEVWLTSYGKASGFAIDPIEKKPLNHFYPGSSVLSFGTAGCNLGCRFCQNWDISKARAVERLTDSATPAQIADAAVAAGCRSVAFTYNDPVIFAEYAIDTAKACHERGVRTVAVTAGYITAEARGEFFSVMDAANVDLKAFTDRFYEKLCFAHLEPVLETLRYLKRETSVWFEVTTLLIPGENDSPEEVDRLCGWVARELGPEVPLHFSAFHPDFKLTGHDATPPGTIRRARAQALAHGLRHVYSGNIRDPGGQSSTCATCGELLVERDGYRLRGYRLDGSRCRRCGARLPGRFSDDGPDAWNPRRARLVIA
ncbi:MAG: AmmeMemoRadiSam system radical SAM enzyme [Sorangiineae bacterium]|nr:AmmeMemoRadiSam system radical SAM enzyme [Polyangiaceae bacterium]MEB2321464.1 AmmeMemoRadiSam system radical SAM enzyme [Sorangiineae bacterium]